MTKRWTDTDLILEQVGVTMCFAVMCSWTIFRDLWGTREGPRWFLALIYGGFLSCWVWEHHARVRLFLERVKHHGLRSLSRADVSTVVSFSACVVLALTALAS